MAARNVSGIATVGVELCQGAWSNNATLPASVTALARINAIGGYNLETEQIDSSALADIVTEYIQGRQDGGGSLPITINVTDDTLDEWMALQGQTVWFQIWHPTLSKGIFVVATVPQKIGFSDIGQNALWTAEITLTINYYYGYTTAIYPSNLITLSLDKSSDTVAVGSTTSITATVLPAGTTVTWSSSDTTVATVSSGTVSGVAAGTATITATAGTKTAVCVVTVTGT